MMLVIQFQTTITAFHLVILLFGASDLYLGLSGAQKLVPISTGELRLSEPRSHLVGAATERVALFAGGRNSSGWSKGLQSLSMSMFAGLFLSLIRSCGVVQLSSINSYS
jgi:hypothetical protein